MPGDKAGNEFASALLTFSQPPPSRSLVGQREVESIEEVEAPFDNLLVGPVHLSPAFQDQVDGHAFPAPELVVLEVRVVDDLADQPQTPVSDCKALEERLERAVLALVGEFAFEHVEPHGARARKRVERKGEPGFRVEEPLDEPGGADAVNLRSRPRHPKPAAVT